MSTWTWKTTYLILILMLIAPETALVFALHYWEIFLALALYYRETGLVTALEFDIVVYQKYWMFQAF